MVYVFSHLELTMYLLWDSMGSKMTRKCYHLILFGLFVFAVTYDMLVVPLTEQEAAFGGRLKFLTFIDMVNIFYCTYSL